MSSNGPGQPPKSTARSGLPTFGNFGSALLERGNPGLRKSTPESEALASSDEEVEQSRLRSAAHRKTATNRRSSLLAEQQSNNEAARRLSFANASHSPVTGSQPNTPGVSHDTWSAISPGVGAWNTGSAYPFGTNIWGANSRDPPTRLQEVRQDNPDARMQYSSSSQLNPSVQRSMSFSVGQSEYDGSHSSMETSGRPVHGLTRRSSRPGTLGHEYRGLSRVNESEDSEPFSATSATFTPSNRGVARAMSNTSIYTSSAFRGMRQRNSTHDISEMAIEDSDEPGVFRQPIRGATSRRMSDLQNTVSTKAGAGSLYSSTMSGHGRNVPHWSSNLDFGALDTIPQSRRHSFADVPTRRGSLGSNGKSTSSWSATDILTLLTEEDDHSASYDAGSQHLSQENECKLSFTIRICQGLIRLCSSLFHTQ